MRTRNSAKQQSSIKAPSPEKGTKDRKDLQVSIETPKVKKRRSDQWLHTPGRDDILFSQHFDSQAVVGWDCNSPDHVKGLRKFNAGDGNDVTDLIKLIADEEDDAPAADARNTPPLLGLWKDSSVQANSLLDNAPQNKLQKKKRNRKKSGKDNVSQALFEKLAQALDDKNEDVDVKEVDEVVNTDDDNHTSDVENVPEQPTTALNCSDDLFELPPPVNIHHASNISSAIHKENVKVENPELEITRKSSSSQEGWSDDEFLEGDDSFIVKATQQPAGIKTFNSPVFGIKRKGSSYGDQPKTKCSRFSFQLGDSNNNQKSVSVSSNRFTSLQSKTKLTNGAMAVNKQPICAVTRSSAAANAVTVSTSVVLAQSVKPSSKKGAGISSSLGNKAWGHTQVSSVSSNFYSNKTLQARSAVYPTSSAKPSSNNARSFTQHKPLHCSITSASNSTQRSGPRFAHSIVGRNLQYGSGSSFRKHNSFSGPDSPTQHSNTTRRRSISGDEARPAASRNVGVASVIRPNQNPGCGSKTVKNQTLLSGGKPPSIPNRLSGGLQGTTNTSSQNSALQEHSVPRIKSIITTLYGKPSSNQVATCSSTHGNKPTFSVPSNTVSNKLQSTTCGGKSMHANKGYQFRHSKPSSGRPDVSQNSSNVSISTCTELRESKISAMPKVLEFFTSPLSTRVTLSTPSKNNFLDTSISDDLMCQLAEPDEMFESQVNITVSKEDKLDLTNIPDNTMVVEPSRLEESGFNLPKDCDRKNKDTGPSILSTAMSSNSKQLSFKTQSGQVKPESYQNTMPAPKCVKTTEQGKLYRFRDTQKSDMTSDKNFVAAKAPKMQVNEPYMPDKVTSTSICVQKGAPVDFSEDLFSGDDDDLLLSNDDLDEPQLLAMLDEVEMLATQQSSAALHNTTASRNMTTLDASTCQNPQTIDSQQNQKQHQPSKPSNNVINQTETNIAVPVSSNSELFGSQEHQSSSQGLNNSQGRSNSQPTSGSQNKYSPEEIERKKQLAMAKRKNRSAQGKR